jgi:two-component system NarL family sensor kinase
MHLSVMQSSASIDRMIPKSTSPFFLQVASPVRWGIIIFAFLLITVLDFSTPPQYILAYLYVIPILVSVSFLKTDIAKRLLFLAVLATLLDLFIPQMVLSVSFITINRLLAALSIIVSSYFMIRYINHQSEVQEQQQLVETERNLSKMREDFVATLTHDLKTPLLGEQAVLQHLLEGTFGPLGIEHRQTLEALGRNKHRQLELVDNLLSVYRNDNVGVELRTTSIDLDELIADCLTEFQTIARERQLELRYYCHYLPPKVKGDSLQLKRVIANLLQNALNYTPAGGHIEVRLSQQTAHLLVEVCDDGPGLKEEELESVFHRFYRAAGTRDTVGTGLGLYLSRQLIEAHRGRLWVSNSPQGGCQFSFLLPIQNQDDNESTDEYKGKLV